MKMITSSCSKKNKPNQSQFYPPQADSNLTLLKWGITRICFGFFVAKWVGFGYNMFSCRHAIKKKAAV